MSTPYYEPDLTQLKAALPQYPRFILKMAYAAFSESMYSAGWMNLDDDLLHQFKLWLVDKERQDLLVSEPTTGGEQ